MTAKLTERDRKLLMKCALCRWLTTSELQRLYFPKTSLNAVQKRLRKLADGGFLRAHREHPTAEIIHAVGPKAKSVLQELGVEWVTAGEVPKQIEHLIGINKVRIALEAGEPSVRYFFAHWQLADLGWSHPVIPDAVFAFEESAMGNLVLEYDRGTEPLDALLRKLEFYDVGIRGFPIGAAIIVTETDRRTDLLARTIKDRGLRLEVLVAPLEETFRDGPNTLFLNIQSGRQERLTQRTN